MLSNSCASFPYAFQSRSDWILAFFSIFLFSSVIFVSYAHLMNFAEVVWILRASSASSTNFLASSSTNYINCNTSLASRGALAYCLQRRTIRNTSPLRRLNSKWPTGSGNISNPRLLEQLWLSEFFDSIISSMRTSKIQNGCQGSPKWPTGYGKEWRLRFLGVPVNFC